jgi:hypothetical protein
MKRGGDQVLARALRTVAVDWYFCKELVRLGFKCDETMLTNYFCTHQVDFLKKYCCKTEPFHKFCMHLQYLMTNFDLPSTILKPKVNVELKHYGPHDCVAIYVKDVFEILHKEVPESRNYTSEMIHFEVRSSNGKYGDVSRNVSFKTQGGHKIRRAMLIRRDVLMRFS